MSKGNESREELARRGLRIVNQVARRRWRHYRRRIDLDELRGIGREALVWVLDHYEPSRGSFEAYARQRIGGAMADEARKRCRRRMRRRPAMAAGQTVDRLARPLRIARRSNGERRTNGSVLSPCRAEWGAVLHRSDVDELAVCSLPDPESCAMTSSLAEGVRGVVRELPTPQREVIERHYFGGEPLGVVGEDLGLSRHAVGRLHRKTLSVVGRRIQGLVEPG